MAQEHGATYVTAGHIYPTDCKRGLAARGTQFLERVCRVVSIPVYAIGGISPQRMDEVKKARRRRRLHDVRIYENIRDDYF